MIWLARILLLLLVVPVAIHGGLNGCELVELGNVEEVQVRLMRALAGLP